MLLRESRKLQGTLPWSCLAPTRCYPPLDTLPTSRTHTLPAGPALTTGVPPIVAVLPALSWMWPQTTSAGRFSSIAGR